MLRHRWLDIPKDSEHVDVCVFPSSYRQHLCNFKPFWWDASAGSKPVWSFIPRQTWPISPVDAMVWVSGDSTPQCPQPPAASALPCARGGISAFNSPLVLLPWMCLVGLWQRVPPLNHMLRKMALLLLLLFFFSLNLPLTGSIWRPPALVLEKTVYVHFLLIFCSLLVISIITSSAVSFPTWTIQVHLIALLVCLTVEINLLNYLFSLFLTCC